MLNIIRKLYSWVTGLKKYHAMHTFVMPPALCFIAGYLICIYSDIGCVHEPGAVEFFLEIVFIIYFGILTICSILAICIAIILKLLSKYGCRYFIKSHIVLYSWFYNAIFIFGLIINTFTILLIIIRPQNIDLGTILYFPFRIIYSLPWFY